MLNTTKFIIFLFVSILLNLQIFAADRPNILWITAEDMSPVLGCYGDKDAITPNIDALAKSGLRYTHAFATAPVCSPSRSCIINGLPATSQGTHQMRSAFPIPAYMKGFPEKLRKAGYFTSNNVKTDYNSANWKAIIKASWDAQGPDAHWRKRKDKNQPFFSVFNLMTSHQSRAMVWPYDKFKKEVQSKLTASEIHDPKKITLPPYYPDTEIIRKTQARFYDCVTAMDKEVGQILKQLKDDGLADDTIVFFYSDHGSGMPRHKRALFDSGMNVAMMLHVPKKWDKLITIYPGTVTDQLVNFADLGPTVLSILKIEAPAYMEGVPFLGEFKKRPRKYVFGHRDRVDEVIDLARSVRSKDFLYIRNYMPHKGYNQPTAWPDLGEVRHEFYKAANRRLTKAQAQFIGPTRPVEELYDCVNDPMNLNNLAGKADYIGKLKEMRQALKDHVIKTKDLGFLPEAMQWQRSEGTVPYEMKSENYNIESIFAAANDVGVAREAQFRKHLESDDAAIRYWGAVGLTAMKGISSLSHRALFKATKDDSVNVRIQAAEAMVKHVNADFGLMVLMRELGHQNMAAVMHAARTTEMIAEDIFKKAKISNHNLIIDAMKRCDARMKRIRPPGTSPVVVQSGEMDMAMFIGFSTEAFIKKYAK